MTIKRQLAAVDALFVKMFSFEFATKDSNDPRCGPWEEHNFDHIVLIDAVSSFLVCIEDQQTLFEGPCLVAVSAGKKHIFLPQKAGSTFCCMQVLRDRNDWTKVLDPKMIPAGSPLWNHAAPTFVGMKQGPK